jgi:selenide,water dikinase
MPIDFKRRKKVMARSVKLGHCVCNPKLPCPCPVFKEHNVCTCAGEKLAVKKGDIPLTRHVKKAGCASKIGQADLLAILSKLPEVTDPRVLVGAAAGDDAGIFKIDDRHTLVQTVDVFTPCVDDPYLFGRISAANSLSDVYAMGGKPLTALSIIGFPIEELDGSIMEAILKGGMDVLEEANCPLLGGHSINDEEIKCGFAVTGLIDESQVVERGKAQPGDALILTKPIGTGMVSFGAQIGRIDAEGLAEVGESMAELNKDAAELMVKFKAHACTDVTGYGLAGHLVEMVRGSDVNGEVDLSLLPVFAAVKDCVEMDIIPGAIERNQEYSMAWVNVQDEKNEKNLSILFDPQTSGGLLIALPQADAASYVEAMHDLGHTSAAIIGRITEKPAGAEEGQLVITNNELKNLIGKGKAVEKGKADKVYGKNEKIPPAPAADKKQPAPEEVLSCCESPPDLGDTESPDSLPLFMDFMTQANADGHVDKRTKKIMAVALSVAFRCKPCLVSHMKTAMEMGITKTQIDEAANLAIAFGGCSAMMVYREVCKELGV